MPKTNPYTPGEGLYPRKLVGRDTERKTLERALSRIADGAPVRGHVLYGPRGCGKTALLENLRLEARKRGVRRLFLMGDAETARAALDAFAEERADFYGPRLQELKAGGLKQAAAAAAAAVRGGAIAERALDAALDAALGLGSDARAVSRLRDGLAAAGFVWEVAPGYWAGGIPSLLETAEREFAPDVAEPEAGGSSL